MTQRQKLSYLCTLLGCACVLIAAGLLLQNTWAERTAQESTTTALTAIAQVTTPVEPSDAQSNNLTQSESDGTAQTLAVAEQVYCGVLAIDSLGLTLPIQADFSYPNLKSSPCLYTQEGNEALVIAAHNYTAHFGNLPQLQVGDVIAYTPLGADTQYYTITARNTVEENDWQAVEGSADELILFTCNIQNNNQRIVVRCTQLSTSIDVSATPIP